MIVGLAIFRERESRRTDLEEELEDWKRKYQELDQIVAPFREQLQAYEAERQALTSHNDAVKNDLKQLALQYAQILGHQNQKQKIKHMVKLKEQNLELKDVSIDKVLILQFHDPNRFVSP